MGIGNIGKANATLLSDWNEAREKVQREQQQKEKSSQQKAMEAFAQALNDCDKAMETVVDKHHESVAKSAAKQAEYRKKVAKQEQIQKRADDQRQFFEESTMRQINMRNMIKQLRIDEENRRAAFSAMG